MDAILRAFFMYAILFLLFRVSGRRTLSESTPFDFVLLLVIGEATQQALLGTDYSMTNAILVIVTLLIIDIGLSIFKEKSKLLSKVFEGVPTVLVIDGKPLKDKMKKARIDENDVLEEARQRRGLERMDQIKYAILEISGGISIIPKDNPASSQT